MKDLLEKLEAATEGSMELDQAIGDALGIHQPDAYTRSLDDALLLVQQGLDCEISRLVIRSGELACHAWVGDYLGKQHKASNAKTPALALCIAALRARRGSMDERETTR